MHGPPHKVVSVPRPSAGSYICIRRPPVAPEPRLSQVCARVTIRVHWSEPPVTRSCGSTIVPMPTLDQIASSRWFRVHCENMTSYRGRSAHACDGVAALAGIGLGSPRWRLGRATHSPTLASCPPRFAPWALLTGHRASSRGTERSFRATRLLRCPIAWPFRFRVAADTSRLLQHTEDLKAILVTSFVFCTDFSSVDHGCHHGAPKATP